MSTADLKTLKEIAVLAPANYVGLTRWSKLPDFPPVMMTRATFQNGSGRPARLYELEATLAWIRQRREWVKERLKQPRLRRPKPPRMAMPKPPTMNAFDDIPELASDDDWIDEPQEVQVHRPRDLKKPTLNTSPIEDPSDDSLIAPVNS